MRIIRNEQHIRVRHFIGRYVTMAGLIVLLVGLVVSFLKPEWIWVLTASMLVGVTFSIVGGAFAERYVGPLAHHEALVSALKGLDNQHVLVQYVLPVPHVLLEPGGLTAFVVKSQPGQVVCQQEGRWKHQQRGRLFRQLAGQEGVGAPDLDAEHQVGKLARWLADHLPDVEVPTRAAIVFVNPQVELDAEASPVPAFYGKKVKGWLRGPGKRKSLPADVYRHLVDALGADDTA